MRIAFAGTPEFAATALRSLLAAGHSVALVLTQPDRPAGRGMRLQPSPVKALALQQGLALTQPRSLRLDGKYPDDAYAAQQALLTAAPDVMVVAAYGLLLPPWALGLPRHGCLNIHASLLPRWRGAAPIPRAIEAGDADTGITIMQMDAGLDTGDMRLVGALAISPDDTAATLHDRLAMLGGGLVVQALDQLDNGTLARTAQPAGGISYARKIDKGEAAIDWSLPAAMIERRVRAFDPFPGASFTLDGATVKLWRARCLPPPGAAAAAPPGTLVEAGSGRLVVACGDGALELLTLQRAGGRRIDARAFVQALPGLAGRSLGTGSGGAGSGG